MKINSLIFLCLFTNILIAQNSFQLLNNFKTETQAQITLNSNGIPDFIKFPAEQPLELQGATLHFKVLNFLESYSSIFDLKSTGSTLSIEQVKQDNYGFNQVIVKQFYNTIPVYDAQLRFHFNPNNQLTAINGTLISGIKINSQPILSSTSASEKAIAIINDQKLNVSGYPLQVISNELMIYPKGLIEGFVVSHHLVYRLEIRNNVEVREFLFIDAQTGNLIEQITGIAHAIDRRLYENNFGNLVWQEGDVFPGTLDQWQQNELVAAEHMYNFFNNAFGYVSYDGLDAQMVTINNNPNINCPNASWNGVTANYCTGTAADDVVAHEWGHAYTQYTSNLIYAYQSGAINEAYSDIWGETVDLLNNYEDAGENFALRTGCFSSVRWRIGEDASAFGNPIRDMWNPNCNGDPGKVTDAQYSCGEFDSGGVHINSGIPNHAYALLVDGGSYNGQTINGIGFTKAAHIFWRAQSVYLTSTSDFANLADALEASCSDLIGINLEGLSTSGVPVGLSGEVITLQDCEDVARAILAVEMRIDPTACNYQPILVENLPLCEVATSNPVFVEDWESGTDGWSFDQLPVNFPTWTARFWELEANLPDGRTGHGIFAINPIIGDCQTDLENGIMRLESPVITMPDVTTGVFELAFNHYIATETNWDGGNLKYSLEGGLWTVVPSSAFTHNPYNGSLNTITQGNDNPMQGEEAFTGSDGGSVSGSWGQSVIDLSALGVGANSNIQFRWELGTDGCNGRIGWYLDEVVVYNCSNTLSVNDANYLKSNIKVFPNPSNGIFTLIKPQFLTIDTVEIYDINGRFILSNDLSKVQEETTINLSEVTTGIYFMKIKADNSTATLKLIKQ